VGRRAGLGHCGIENNLAHAGNRTSDFQVRSTSLHRLSGLIDDDDGKFCHPTCEMFHLSIGEYERYVWGICPRGTEAKLWDGLHVSRSCGVHLSLRQLAWNPTSWDQDPLTEWTTLVSRPHTWVSGATQKHVPATY
jgi:hypothetical protein